MTEDRFSSRLAEARRALLATASGDGTPHLVPIVFAIHRDRLVTAVDHKPKTTRDLKRLRNVAENPRASVLVDHYDEDWQQLWWVRVDGTAQVLENGTDFEAGIDALAGKYTQYRDLRPGGPVIEIAIERITGWDASN